MPVRLLESILDKQARAGLWLLVMVWLKRLEKGEQQWI
jgi:hypothetical protein